MAFDHSVLTNVGWDALTDAEAGQHIQYVHMEAGDGSITGGDTEMFGLTALKHKVMNLPITGYSNDGQGQITLVGVLSSANVTTGFYFREVGVKCTIDGGPELLYTVANSGAVADFIPASSASPVTIQSVQIIIKIDRAPNVTVVVAPGVDVTCQNIGPATAGAGHFRDKIGQVCWFKRLTSPKKTLTISETSDLVSIDLPVIDQDLDMWVALGNPDVFPNFSTIQKALDWLVPWNIKAGKFCTIHVAAGTWVGAAARTLVDNPNGSQIKIIGTLGTIKNVTSVTGTTSAVTVNGTGSFTDVAVGDFVMLKMTASGGSGTAGALSGIRKVTAKTASSITFDPWWWGLTFPTDLNTVNGGTITPLKTVLLQPTAALGTYNMMIQNNGLGLLKNFASICGALIPDPGSHGVYGLLVYSGVAQFETVGAYGWQVEATSVPGRAIGIACWGTGGATLAATDCAACNCASGIANSTGGTTTAYLCFANSNDYIGFRFNSGAANVSRSYACGNNFAGVGSETSASTGCGGVFACYNKTYGLLCWLNSYMDGFSSGEVSGAFLSTVRNNGTRDIQLTVISSIIRLTGGALNYGTANIAPNTLSNDGCYFMP